MKTIKLQYGDILVIDPCYIKSVKSCGDLRFDGLKCVKTLYEGDDGCFDVYRGDEKMYEGLGVDSGRIWALVAEFEVDIELDAGYSGYVSIMNVSDYSKKAQVAEKILAELTIK